MRLTKMYKPAEAGDPRAVMGLNRKPIVVDYIRVDFSNDRVAFKPERVASGAAEGWLSLGDGKITIKTKDDLPDLVYAIERAPGHYCCECGSLLDDEHSARRHVLIEHAGMDPREVPDNAGVQATFWDLLAGKKFKCSHEKHPSGYERINYYDCVKA